MRREKKTKPAIWQRAFPDQLRRLNPEPRRRKPSSGRNLERRLYKQEARAFIEAANAKGQFCPVAFVLWGQMLPVEDVHHTRGRGYGGRGPLLRDQRFWLAVSRKGHDWIHNNTAAAIQHGWLCERGLWNRHD